MSPSLALTTAVTFVWLGMVTAISFVEAPLKFRAPGVTLPIGLGIGRLVFRALNIAELTLAVVLTSAVLAAMPTARIIISATVPVVILVVQIVLVRPRLARRSDRSSPARMRRAPTRTTGTSALKSSRSSPFSSSGRSC